MSDVYSPGGSFKVERPKNIQQGVSTTIRAAIDPNIKSKAGAYMENTAISKAEEYAYDGDAVKELWSLSERLVGHSFGQ